MKTLARKKKMLANRGLILKWGYIFTLMLAVAYYIGQHVEVLRCSCDLKNYVMKINPGAYDLNFVSQKSRYARLAHNEAIEYVVKHKMSSVALDGSLSDNLRAADENHFEMMNRYVDNCEDSLFCKFVYGFDVAMVSLAEPRLVLEIMGVVARKKPEHYKEERYSGNYLADDGNLFSCLDSPQHIIASVMAFQTRAKSSDAIIPCGFTCDESCIEEGKCDAIWFYIIHPRRLKGEIFRLPLDNGPSPFTGLVSPVYHPKRLYVFNPLGDFTEMLPSSNQDFLVWESVRNIKRTNLIGSLCCCSAEEISGEIQRIAGELEKIESCVYASRRGCGNGRPAINHPSSADEYRVLSEMERQRLYALKILEGQKRMLKPDSGWVRWQEFNHKMMNLEDLRCQKLPGGEM